MSDGRGDVVWSDDPFTDGAAGRPWLVLNDDTHPFGGQQYMAVHSPQQADVTHRQGRLAGPFVDRVVTELVSSIESG